MSPILGIIASGANVAAGAFESIASASGDGSSGTITFSSIPSGYQHLQIRFIGKGTGNTTSTTTYSLQFNSDTGSNYAYHRLTGNGSSASVSGATANSASIVIPSIIPQSPTNGALDNMHAVGIIDIHDYLSTSNNKTIRVFTGDETNRGTTPTGAVVLTSGLWFASPAAITQINIIAGANAWTTTSQFALYGIKA